LGNRRFHIIFHNIEKDVNKESYPLIIRGSSPLNAAHLIPLCVKMQGKSNKKMYLRRLVDKKKKFDQLKFDVCKNMII
jgi:hypothetical protein